MNIVIIGGGFAGISALKNLSHKLDDHNIILVSESEHSEFRPLLPDVISKTVSPEYLRYPLRKLTRKYKAGFRKAGAEKINISESTVTLDDKTRLSWDYLICATGSKTPLPKKFMSEKNVYTPDSLKDVSKISAIVENGLYSNYIVCGGGYTGIETATHIKKGLNRSRHRGRVIIAERGNSILKNLPAWMRDYVIANIENMGIEIMTGTQIDSAGSGSCLLSDGTRLEKSLVIWSTGLKPSLPDIDSDLYGKSGGRLNMDDFMRCSTGFFGAGDCVCIKKDASCVRMSVQASLTGGILAADNIKREVAGRNRRPYRFFDPGFLVPMANGRSCGKVLGLNVRGGAATFLHYFMGALRSYGIKNKIMVALEAVRNRKQA